MRDIIKPHKEIKISSEDEQGSFDNALDMFFNHKGKLSRSKFLIASFCIGIVSWALDMLYPEDATLTEDMIFLTVGTAFVIYPCIVVTIRRLHDLNKSGWFSLILFIPLVNIAFILWLVFKKGDDREGDSNSFS